MAYGVELPQAPRWTTIAAGACAALVFFATVTDAEARRRKNKRAVYSPPYASIVIDANSGRILQATNADAHRFPASITKVMTLYMLFEQLERGKMRLDTPIVMSHTAARKPPSKLGIRPGQSITAHQAILALVTKSANDVAAAVAEHIGGTEPAFARMMTARARTLGMNRTRFENASGLPDPDQVTTARDLARLGRAIRTHFPRYYGFFATKHFRFGRRNMRNHNKLLGRVRGVDGIKTGYTRASGFNLLTSAQLGNRRIIAVVLGGRSGRSRDAIMANLVASHIQRGSTRHTIAAIPKPSAGTVRFAAAPTGPMPPERPDEFDQKDETAAAKTHLKAEAAGKPVRLSAYAPLRTAQPAVVVSAVRSKDLVPTASIPGSKPVLDGSTRIRAVHGNTAAGSSRTATPSDLRWVRGRAPAASRDASGLVPPAPIAAAPRPPRKPATVVHLQKTEQVEAETPRRPKAAQIGVMIQVGATDAVAKAKALLDRAKIKSRGTLAGAQPFTETVRVKGSTLYRARFAGLSEKSAERACRTLKRSGFGCFTTRN